MIGTQILAAVTPEATRHLRRWVIHLGGLGLIPLGLLDSSIIPIPGSMDIVTIILCARQQDWWIYYALMATTGSVAGAFITYRLARKGGEKALERKFQARQVEKIRKIFERWGFGALAVPAMLPPPMPLVPFLIAAGAMQYPAKKFLAAFTLGRLVRYSILAYLSARYGRAIIGFMGEHGHPVAFAIAGLALLTAFAAFLVWRGKKEGEEAAS